MERLKIFRNIAIVAAIAAGVYFLPGGGRAANTFEAALWVAFGVGIAYLGAAPVSRTPRRAARPRRCHRGVLYGAIAFAVFLLAARARMWETGVGELVWFVLAACRLRLACGLPPLARLLTARTGSSGASYPRMDGGHRGTHG